MNYVQKFLVTFLFVSNIGYAVDPQRLFLVEAALALAPAAVQQPPADHPFKGNRKKTRSAQQKLSQFKHRSTMRRVMQPK